MTVRFALLCLLALAAAAVLALLANAVFALGREPEREPPAAGIAAALLGATDDRELRDALALYRARDPEAAGPQALAENAAVEAELTQVARDASPRVRSAAANLIGILLVEDARNDTTATSRFLQLALERFREAVTAEPGNEEAKHNLELLVALLERGSGELGQEGGSEGASGAGSSPEGSGY